MRTLILLFVIYTIRDVVQGDNSSLTASQITVRSYPNKALPVFHKNLKILNRSYHKQAKELFRDTKKVGKNLKYTVFPAYSDNIKPIKKVGSLPDSLYFPFEKNDEQKTRVKKVLPNYQWTGLRKKRTADEKADNSSKRVETNKESPTKIVGSVPKNANKEGKVVDKPTADITAKTVNPTAEVKAKETRRSRKVNNNEIIKKVKTSEARRKSKSKTHEGRKRSKHVNGDKKTKKSKRGKKGNKNKINKAKRSHKHKDARRLIAARDALIEDYPYVVSIQKEGEHWCSGALLNQRLVITTANCVWKSSHVSRLRVRAGSRHTDRDGQTAKIAEVMKHPNWSIRRNPDNDVALLLLDRNFRFQNSLHAVDLPNRAMMPVFDDAWITSWGSERRDGVFEKHRLSLQVYHARLMDHDKCNNVTKRYGVAVTKNFICLAQDGRRAPCTRDTGAPAVSDGVLWGLASWGIRKLCGTERFPAIFSYLASHSNMDFIANATHYLMSEQRHYPFPDRFSLSYVVPTPTTTPPY